MNSIEIYTWEDAAKGREFPGVRKNYVKTMLSIGVLKTSWVQEGLELMVDEEHISLPASSRHPATNLPASRRHPGWNKLLLEGNQVARKVSGLSISFLMTQIIRLLRILIFLTDR